MRIGMMADVYKPHVSGITNYIVLNKRYLESHGHEVFVFTFGDEDYDDGEKNVVRSPALPLFDTGYYLSLRYSPKAQKLLRTMDVVHVHHPFLSGSLALRYCRPRSIPVIFTNHTRYDLYAQVYLPVLPDVIGETALEAYLSSFCRGCDRVIAPSEGMRGVLKRLGIESFVDVVPNGVDLNPFQHVQEPVDRASLGFTGEDVVMVYAGRLGPEKNLGFLMRSFAGTARAYDNVRLLIVGDGRERDNLMDQVRLFGLEYKVHFTGMVPYADLPRYLASADAFVTASVTEVHPLSIIEAMAAGLPVLGIESVGVGDVVIPGETGLLTPEDDLAAFTASMVRLATDPELRCRLADKARAVAQAYDIDRTTEMMLERYRLVMEAKTSQKRSLRARLTRILDNWSR